MTAVSVARESVQHMPLPSLAHLACTVDGCTNDTRKGARGLCGMHAQRQKRRGTTGGADYVRAPGRTVEQRVFDRLAENPDTGCWEWQGALRNGYGAVGINGCVAYVHRWVFEFLVTEIPVGLVFDHLCLNRACANPQHVEPVTRAVNNARGGHHHGERKRVAA